ncbi:MerR family DNA-binding transcriptional regulator [Paenibacillus elgii]|uniref:MerR family DNA-binding transcriptional regulator n=1 Tax=Paenibacillus elgii TaxID=189691 RepID=UPI002041FDA5|nr:MerR family DNA-binding transcriptional regulator [Paenibacillus elgii]MCM3271102.1 MerR family DNA-binding transcriptional regulator [Paenibacillus elgii]
MYRIGQLAKEAGISIRTLRYYDELGVLKPSFVSEAGYEENDPRAEEWISLLRDIHGHLGEPPDSPVSRRLAERLLEIEGQWFGNREDVLEKYWEWIRPEPGGREKVLGLDEETMAYIERIFADGQAGVNMNHGWALQCYLRIIVTMHSILR